MTFGSSFSTICLTFLRPHFCIVFSLFVHHFRYPWFCKNLILTQDSLQKTRNRRFEKVSFVQWILTYFFHVFRIIFPSIFHTNFMFFPKPLPETIFGGSKRRSMLKSAILEPCWIPRGSQNRPLSHHFQPKWRRKAPTPNEGERPGADLGATWRRKRAKTTQAHILTDF